MQGAGQTLIVFAGDDQVAILLVEADRDFRPVLELELAQRPSTVIVRSARPIFTLAGTGRGFFPMRDISLVPLCAIFLSGAYQISQSTSPPSFFCRASRSLITPRLVLRIEIPSPPSTGFSDVLPL